MTAVDRTTPTRTLEAATALHERVEGYAAASKSPATWRAYRTDWRHLEAWAVDVDVDPWPLRPHDLIAYLDHQATAGYAAATIGRRLSAIAQRHRGAGLIPPTEDPHVRTVWRGIRRTIGTAQRQVDPATTDVVRRMVDALPDTRRGVRDRAILLVGFAGAFRRSELAALDVEDLTFTDDGVKVRLRRSKTDQEGEGRNIGIPAGVHASTCPVRALTEWLDLSGHASGPVFGVCGHTVGRRVKAAAKAAGIEGDFAGHSLRAGLATSAAAAGASERSIMRQTGHKSLPMVRRYIREGQVFVDNAAAAVGL